MGNFVVSKADPARFAEDFRLEPVAGYTPTPSEQSFLDKLIVVLDHFLQDAQQFERPEKYSKAVRETAQKICGETVAELRTRAEEFAEGNIAADRAADNALILRGKYIAKVEQLTKSLFIVAPIWDKIEGMQRAIDLEIRLRSDLPEPNNAPTPEKETLFVGIFNALTIVKAVCQQMMATRAKLSLRSLNSSPAPVDPHPTELLDEYVRKLNGIGQLGLVGSHTKLATLALDYTKEEFVAREAGRIKNTYIRKLGVASGLAAIFFLGVYVAVEANWVDWSWGKRHGSLALATTGAAIGTWLSFSIRRVELTFEQLAALENDQVDPGLRVLFVIGLTIIAYLLFWTGMVTIDVGGLKVSANGFKTAGSVAVIFGLFCGLSERALATAISGRAEAFASSLGTTR